MTRLVVGLSLLATVCCAPRRGPLPMAWRPDTRTIVTVHIDTTAIRETLWVLRAALPREAAVCYTGQLKDSLSAEGNKIRVLTLEHATAAVQDSATMFYIYFSKPNAGCDPPTIATGHSHPYAISAWPCTHSDPDVSLLFKSTDVLVSTVWCADGRLEFLFQDGRRGEARWRPES